MLFDHVWPMKPGIITSIYVLFAGKTPTTARDRWAITEPVKIGLEDGESKRIVFYWKEKEFQIFFVYCDVLQWFNSKKQ